MLEGLPVLFLLCMMFLFFKFHFDLAFLDRLDLFFADPESSRQVSSEYFSLLSGMAVFRLPFAGKQGLIVAFSVLS